jgi:hypothetical protein
MTVTQAGNSMFFITGYPRSRTTWFSQFFTEMGVPCGHDRLGKENSLDEYLQSSETIGDSDSGLLFFPNLNEIAPDAKVILIERDIGEVIKSLHNKYGGAYDSSIPLLRIAFENFKQNTKHLHVRYEDINNRLQEIWEYVTDLPYDKDKAKALTMINIQEKV